MQEDLFSDFNLNLYDLFLKMRDVTGESNQYGWFKHIFNYNGFTIEMVKNTVKDLIEFVTIKKNDKELSFQLHSKRFKLNIKSKTFNYGFLLNFDGSKVVINYGDNLIATDKETKILDINNAFLFINGYMFDIKNGILYPRDKTEKQNNDLINEYRDHLPLVKYLNKVVIPRYILNFVIKLYL